MSDKQLTGTITLPGVDPELYELTGEYRKPHKDDWFAGVYGAPARTPACDEGPRIILRRKPRKVRVTPTQADLDAAVEQGIPYGIKCRYSYDGKDWRNGYLRAIIPFHVRERYIVNDAPAPYCEIEKEVTE